MIAAVRQSAPIKFVWEGAYVTYTYVTVLKVGPTTANAQKLIAFLNRARLEVDAGNRLPWAEYKSTQVPAAELIPQVNVNPQNASKCIIDDANWLVGMCPDGKTNAVISRSAATISQISTARPVQRLTSSNRRPHKARLHLEPLRVPLAS